MYTINNSCDSKSTIHSSEIETTSTTSTRIVNVNPIQSSNAERAMAKVTGSNLAAQSVEDLIKVSCLCFRYAPRPKKLNVVK